MASPVYVAAAHCPLLLTPHLQLPGPRLTYHQHWHWLVSTRKHCQHMTTWHKAQLKRGTQSNLGAKIHKLPWMWDAGLWSLSHYRVKHFVTCWIYVTLLLLTIVNTQTSAAGRCSRYHHPGPLGKLGVFPTNDHWEFPEKMLCVFVMMLLPPLLGSPETSCLGWPELVPYLWPVMN